MKEVKKRDTKYIYYSALDETKPVKPFKKEEVTIDHEISEKPQKTSKTPK